MAAAFLARSGTFLLDEALSVFLVHRPVDEDGEVISDDTSLWPGPATALEVPVFAALAAAAEDYADEFGTSLDLVVAEAMGVWLQAREQGLLARLDRLRSGEDGPPPASERVPAASASSSAG